MFKIKFVILSFISLLIVGCGATHPLTQRCIDTTPPASGARWNCLQQANAQIYAATPTQQPVLQAPAYDPFRAPTIVNTAPGLTSGNTNYDLSGLPKGQSQQQNRTYNCTTQYYGGVANTTCR
jgi:hypothetical protein